MKKKYIVLAVVTPLLLAADLLTKRLAEARLSGGVAVSVVEDFFDFRLARNMGAAFGLGHDWSPAVRTPFFLLVSVVALTVVVVLIRKTRDEELLAPLGLACILAGALGNIHDRVRFGHVVDFILVHWKDSFYWPTFNVADMGITAGAAILFIYTLFLEPRDKSGGENS